MVQIQFKHLSDASDTYGSKISCKEPPHLWGAYSEYLYLPPRAMVHKVRDDLLPEVGVLICAVLGNAIRWLQTIGRISQGDTVVIQGPGQQGLVGVIVAKEAGAEKIILTGMTKDHPRFELAKVFGADEIIDVEKVDPLERVTKVTHRFPLKEAEKAVKLAGGEIEGEDPIKVVIIP